MVHLCGVVWCGVVWSTNQIILAVRQPGGELWSGGAARPSFNWQQWLTNITTIRGELAGHAWGGDISYSHQIPALMELILLSLYLLGSIKIIIVTYNNIDSVEKIFIYVRVKFWNNEIFHSWKL